MGFADGRFPYVRIILIAIALLLAASAAGTWYVLRPAGSRVVEIVQDGEVLYTIDLASAEDQTIVVEYSGNVGSEESADADGATDTAVSAGSNTIEISGGEIRVREADCSDQTCVKMGKLYSESLPIVCLPHKLIIRYQTE